MNGDHKAIDTLMHARLEIVGVNVLAICPPIGLPVLHIPKELRWFQECFMSKRTKLHFHTIGYKSPKIEG